MLKPSKYLRISLVSRCNLSCFYCHREGDILEKKEELSPEELQFVCKIAHDVGFHKFKLTGGEPTLRQDICTIISLLVELGLPDLSMITNGITLSEQAADLWQAGLRRINVTLNTLRQERFQQIQRTNHSSVKTILQGISVAKEVGFQNIKINFVYFDDDSEQDLKELLSFTKEHDCVLVVLPELSESSNYTLDYLYNKLQSYGIVREETLFDREGICKRFLQMESGASVMLRIDELANQRPYYFCDKCEESDRCREGIFPIRLSANGELIPCMASMEHRIPIHNLLERHDENAVKQAFSTIERWCRYCE